MLLTLLFRSCSGTLPSFSSLSLDCSNVSVLLFAYSFISYFSCFISLLYSLNLFSFFSLSAIHLCISYAILLPFLPLFLSFYTPVLLCRLIAPSTPRPLVASGVRRRALRRRGPAGAPRSPGPGDRRAGRSAGESRDRAPGTGPPYEHHPDVATGLVIDGPLAAEYVEALAAFGLRYLLVRQDAATWPTARRLVDGAIHRGERLDRDAAPRS